MKPLLLLAGLLTLAACNTPERVASRHDKQCQSYGYAPGSANYRQCRMVLDVERERNRNSGGGPDLTAQGLQIMRSGQPAPVPKPVTCVPFGAGIQCF
jgi:hypothetical protein